MERCILNGTPAQEPRGQRVARVLDGNIGFAVGEICGARYFPPGVKGKLEAMIRNTLVNRPESFDAFGLKAGDLVWRAPQLRAKIW